MVPTDPEHGDVHLLPTHPLTGATPADLTWLTGHWHARLGDDHVEEHWSPLRANTLVATFRWVRDGAVRFYELEVLEQDGEHVYLRVKHFDPKLIEWEERDAPHEFVLVELDEQGAVFLEVDKPNPRWAVYRRRGSDHLTAYFTRGDDPDPEPGVFEFVRQ
jgi:hypothetical protein